MGLLDRLKRIALCPECRSKGAVRDWKGAVRCRRPGCRHYDSSLLKEGRPFDVSHPVARRSHTGSFDPGPHGVMIRYRNFEGDDVEFEGDRRTVRFRKAHISVRAAPTGRRISLAKKFIENLSDLKPNPAFPVPEPSRVERQILAFHHRRGSTSPRYEELRRKYPSWTP